MNFIKDNFITTGLTIYGIYITYNLMKTHKELQETKLGISHILQKSEENQKKITNEFCMLQKELHKLQIDTDIILQFHKYKKSHQDDNDSYNDNYDYDDDNDNEYDTELLQMEIHLPDNHDTSRSRSHSLSSIKGLVTNFFG